jgi:hypothetical protein
MNENVAVTLCATCGADLRQQPHWTDEQGQSYCDSCWQSQREESPEICGRQSHRICIWCGVAVLRKDCHKNRYGEYICHPCLRSGRRMSRRRQLRRWMATGGRWLLYLAGVLVVLAVAYQLFGLFARRLFNG